MLKQRIITAVLLLAVFVPALMYPGPTPFAVLTLCLIGAAGWEWARMQGLGGGAALASGVLVALGLAALMTWGLAAEHWRGLWLLSAAVWVLLSVWILARGVGAWVAWSRSARWLVGSLLLLVAGAALWQAREQGWVFLLSLMGLVWMADVAAYFGGKRWGRRKLAPLVSPGKTWAGAISGMVGVLILALVWVVLEAQYPANTPSLFSRLWDKGPVLTLLTLVFLTAMAVVGDLVESLVKRSAGVKDSSQLLPGHGGVLDRVDALLPVLPLGMMLVTV